MSAYIGLLLWPFLACLVLVGIHVYFGLHVIKRGIIFIDLSLAQVAALGSTLAFLMGFELNGVVAYVMSLTFALIGGAVFTYTRGLESKVPQEAAIGIVYAVSTAMAIMAVSHVPEGAEHVKYLLVGSLLTTSPAMVLKTAAVYAAVGLFHYLRRDRFMPLSFNVAESFPKSKLWDFLFYATFGIVVTSSVKICGVLVVFVFLVVPSVFAAMLTEKISSRLWLGWLYGVICSAFGLFVSVILDVPPGSAIVCVFGLCLPPAVIIVGGRGASIFRKT